MNEGRIQDARAVAYRALCLGALLQRGEIEFTVQGIDSLLPATAPTVLHEQQSHTHDLLQWLDDECISPHLTPTEYHLLHKPLGTWSERALTHVGWRVESLGVVLWALRHIDRAAPFDQQYELDDVLLPLDMLSPTIDLIWCAALRSEATLIDLRDRAELWNWRSRAAELARMGVRPPEGVTFREIIRFTAERAYNDGKLSHLIDSDFPAFGKPYADLTPDEYALASAIAYERYTALNWLCELSSEWKSMQVDS